MLVLKACPHCQGDLVFEQDAHTGYLECVQCGHILSAGEERRLGVHTTRKGLLRALLQEGRDAPTTTKRVAAR